MAIPEIRQRAGLLFLAVAVGHIILISAQVTSRRGVPLLQVAVFTVFGEVQRVGAGVIDGVRYTFVNYVALQSVQQQNAQLRRQVADLQVRLQRERTQAEKSARLEQLLSLRDQSGLSTTGAQVIAGSVSPEFRTVTIDKGRRDGLRTDMAVLAAAGVVGRVIVPGARAAEVQLLIDRNAAAAGLIARTRAQGVVFGTGDSVLRMDYISATADVKIGDFVLTSGIDRIYPKGFVIGRVEMVERGPTYQTLKVRPVVDFSALEEVLVVLATPPPPEADREKGQ